MWPVTEVHISDIHLARENIAGCEAMYKNMDRFEFGIFPAH